MVRILALVVASHAYRVILTGGTFLPRKYLSVDIRNHRLSVCNLRLSVRNLRLSVRDLRLGICDRHVGIDHQLGLKGGYRVSEIPEELAERTVKI